MLHNLNPVAFALVEIFLYNEVAVLILYRPLELTETYWFSDSPITNLFYVIGRFAHPLLISGNAHKI